MPSHDDPYIGIDLGGTNIQCGVWVKDKLVARDGTKTKPEQGADAVLDRIVKLADKVLDEASIKRRNVAGLGIGAPGAIDVKRGVVLRAPNIGWHDYDLKSALGEKAGLPVVVDNDVNVGAWGERQAGAAQGVDDLLAIFVGTGIGGGLVLNGELYHGAHSTAGEIGFMVMVPSAGKGRRTLEDLASRTHVVRRLVYLIETGYKSAITDMVEGDYSKVRSKIISQAVKAKDPLTLEVVEHAAETVGWAAASVATTLSLETVVLGGGLTEALGDWWVKRVEATFMDYVYPEAMQACKIVASKLEDDAGPVGAVLLARDRLTA